MQKQENTKKYTRKKMRERLSKIANEVFVWLCQNVLRISLVSLNYGEENTFLWICICF